MESQNLMIKMESTVKHGVSWNCQNMDAIYKNQGFPTIISIFFTAPKLNEQKKTLLQFLGVIYGHIASALYEFGKVGNIFIDSNFRDQ